MSDDLQCSIDGAAQKKKGNENDGMRKVKGRVQKATQAVGDLAIVGVDQLKQGSETDDGRM